MAGMAWLRRPDGTSSRLGGQVRVGAALLAGVIAVVVARCAMTSSARGAPPEPEVRAAVAATLAARAAAVADHDKDAYLATDAAGAFQTADAQVSTTWRRCRWLRGV